MGKTCQEALWQIFRLPGCLLIVISIVDIISPQLKFMFANLPAEARLCVGLTMSV